MISIYHKLTAHTYLQLRFIARQIDSQFVLVSLLCLLPNLKSQIVVGPLQTLTWQLTSPSLYELLEIINDYNLPQIDHTYLQLRYIARQIGFHVSYNNNDRH